MRWMAMRRCCLGNRGAVERAADRRAEQAVEQRQRRRVHLDAVRGDQECETQQVVGVPEMRSAMPSRPGVAGSMPSATKTRRVSARASSLRRPCRPSARPRGRPRESGRPSAARSGGRPVRRARRGRRRPRKPRQCPGACGQSDLGMAEQHESQPHDERQHRSESGIARALSEAGEHDGRRMRVDCLIVDDGCEVLGHGACIGRFRQDLKPPIGGLPVRLGCGREVWRARNQGTRATPASATQLPPARSATPGAPGGVNCQVTRRAPVGTSTARRSPRSSAARARRRSPPSSRDRRDRRVPACPRQAARSRCGPARARRRGPQAARDSGARCARTAARAASRVITLRRSR